MKVRLASCSGRFNPGEIVLQYLLTRR